MPKVYTSVPGLQLRIDTFGLATNTHPAEVPAIAAAALEGRSDLRIEHDQVDRAALKPAASGAAASAKKEAAKAAEKEG